MTPWGILISSHDTSTPLVKPCFSSLKCERDLNMNTGQYLNRRYHVDFQSPCAPSITRDFIQRALKEYQRIRPIHPTVNVFKTWQWAHWRCTMTSLRKKHFTQEFPSLIYECSVMKIKILRTLLSLRRRVEKRLPG